MLSSSLVLMYMSSLLQKLALMAEWVLMHLLLSEDLGTAVLGKQLTVKGSHCHPQLFSFKALPC